MYETSAGNVSRPRQCVPLACVQYVRNRSSVVPTALSSATMTRSNTSNELRQPAAGPTSVTQAHNFNIHIVPQTAANFHCSSSVSITSSSHRSAVSNCAPLHTVPMQHSRYRTTDVSATATPTIGLASAVWTPMGATLQRVPVNHAVEVQQPMYAEQLNLLGVHHRLTVTFNAEFSQRMNSIIAVMHQACRVVTSPVFQYTLDQLRRLRCEYCQLTDICIAYGEYQKNVSHCNGSLMLPTLHCLRSSIQLMVDSVNTVTAIFQEMHQWLSSDNRMTVTERGLGLSNKLCQFVPVFIRKMSNFKRSLLMIVPNAMSNQLRNNTSVMPNRASSLMSHVESSAATTETVTSPVSNNVSPILEQLLQQNGNVEPIFVAPMPIVIAPDGLLDDELGMIQVKQEPVETSRKRHGTHELIYIDDGDDNVDDTVNNATASAAVDDSDHMACASASQELDADSSFTLKYDVNVSTSQRRNGSPSCDSPLTTSPSHGMSCSGAHGAVLAADLRFISNSVNDMHDDVADVRTFGSGVSRSSVMRASPEIEKLLNCGVSQSTSTSCTFSTCSTSDLDASHCPNSSRSLVGTGEGHAGQLSSSMTVSCTSDIGRTCSGNRVLDVRPTSGAVAESSAEDCTSDDQSTVTACITDCESGDTGNTTDMLDSCDKINCNARNVDRSSLENDCHVGQTVASAEQSFTAELHDSSTMTDHVSISDRSDVSNHLSDVNLCTISSVCSIKLEGFDCIDTTENTTVDDIVTAVRAFDENSNVVFDKGDICSRDLGLQNSELPCTSSVRTVKKKKKRMPLSRFGRRRKRKQQSKALHSIKSKTVTDDFVSDNSEAVVDVCENNSFEETMHSVHDKSMSSELTENGVLEEQQSEKNKEQCKQKHSEEIGKFTVDRSVTSEASSARVVTKHSRTTIRKHKIKKSRKLLKCGVKQKNVCLTNGSKTQNKINSDSNDVSDDERVEQITSQRLSEFQPLVVEPVCSDKEQVQSTVIAHPNTDMEETCLNSANGGTSQMSDAGCDKGQMSESISDAPETDLVENTDSSSELQSESEAAVDNSDIGSSCLEATGLESKEDSDERHKMDVNEEKCCKLPESECRNEADLLLDDDNLLNVPCKKKRTQRVLSDEEDVENEVSPTGISVSGKSVQRKTRSSVQTNDAKNERKYRSTSAKSVSNKLTKKDALEEKQSEKKQKQCKEKHSEENGKYTVDKRAVSEASRSHTVPKHHQCRTAITKHKLKKSRKLLKSGIKQKTVCLINGSRAHKTVNSDSNDHVERRKSHRLLKSQPVVDGKTKKASSQSDTEVTFASSASIVNSRDNEDEPRLTARDKINAIFKNSQFTQLHSNVSLVHSKINKPALAVHDLPPFKVANDHSKTDAKNYVSPLKNNKISRANSVHDIPKSVVTSGGVTGTAVTSSPVHRTHEPVIRSPGKESTSVITSTSAAHSDVSANAKGRQRNHVEASQMSQKKVGSSKPSSASSLPASAVGHSVQNTVPSLTSMKQKPCFSKTTTGVSSVNHSITESQPLNISAAATLRDPRLTKRPHSVSSEEQRTSHVNERRNAENHLASGSTQWLWEQSDNVRIPTTGPTNTGSEQDVSNKLSSCSHTSADSWVWETNENACTSSYSSLLSIDVNDILSDLSTNCNAAEYPQNTDESSQWHSASRVIHMGSLVSPSFCTADDDHRSSNNTLPSNIEPVTRNDTLIDKRKVETRHVVKDGFSVPQVERLTVTVESHADRTAMLSDVMSPFEQHGSQQYVVSSSIHAQNCSAGNAQVIVHFDSGFTTQANAVIESPSPHSDPGWRLIPLDSSGISRVYKSTKKPLCERKKRNGDPSDPRLKATGLVYNSSSLPDKSHISEIVDKSSNADSQAVVTDSMSGTQQLKLAGQLDCSRSKTLLTGNSLDSRIDTFVSHMDTFSVDKSVENQVDKMMSWRETDLDDAEIYSDNSLGSDDLHQRLEVTGQLDCPRSKTLPTGNSLDNRIDTFVSHMDTFPVDKSVENHVDKMMSWWERDLDDAETCFNNSLGSGDTYQHVEDDDSDADHFIIIDDSDDDSSDELVIDLNSSDSETTLQPCLNQSAVDDGPFTKTVSHHTDVTRNVESIMPAESKTYRNTLSNKDMPSVAEMKENSRVGCRQVHSLSTSNSSSVAGYHNDTVKHRNGTREHTKNSAAEGSGRKVASESSDERNDNTSKYTAKTTAAAASQLSNSKSAFKRNCDDNLVKLAENKSAAANRGIDGNSGEICETVSTRNTHKLPSSFNVAEQNRETLVNEDVDKSRFAGYKPRANASSTRCTVSTCLASLADASEAELGKLKLHMEAKVKVAEHKIAQSNRYECPLNNLTESEKQQLIADHLGEPAVVTEFSIELRLQSVQREIEKTEAAMAKIKNQFDLTKLSMSLKKKYNQYQCVYNNLLVRRDWFYMRMNQLHRYHKSKYLLTLPDDLRFSSEKYVSIEGVPLILNSFTIPLHQCTRLAALLRLINCQRSSAVTPLPRDVLQKLGWLHQERKALLSEICCSSQQEVRDSIECLSEKLILYKYVNFSTFMYLSMVWWHSG